MPQRSCVVCGTKAAKRELIRIVLTPEGSCHVDPTGKHSGRGAYLCQRWECWDKAVKGGRLAHALRGDVSTEDKLRLSEFSRTLVPPAETPHA
ncbi:MAG: YlxR family protein [Dehalococcoidia bacterium]